MENKSLLCCNQWYNVCAMVFRFYFSLTESITKAKKFFLVFIYFRMKRTQFGFILIRRFLRKSWGKKIVKIFTQKTKIAPQIFQRILIVFLILNRLFPIRFVYVGKNISPRCLIYKKSINFIVEQLEPPVFMNMRIIENIRKWWFCHSIQFWKFDFNFSRINYENRRQRVRTT
jgi:hypothetical protein